MILPPGKTSDFEAAKLLIEQVQAEVDDLLSFLAEPDWLQKVKEQGSVTQT